MTNLIEIRTISWRLDYLKLQPDICFVKIGYKRNLERFLVGKKDTEVHYATYVGRVEESYRELEENQKLIVNNDFFYQNSYPYWWESYFSKSTYYRTKRAAMKKFLRKFKDA